MRVRVGGEEEGGIGDFLDEPQAAHGDPGGELFGLHGYGVRKKMYISLLLVL